MKGLAGLTADQACGLRALISRLTGATGRPEPDSPKKQTDRESALLEAMLARPWRRSAVDEQTRADMVIKIRRAVSQDLPMEFSLPFGGYKSWRQPSFPHVDWAEVFWLDYLRGYAQRLHALHPPGVLISFSHTRGVLGWINQLTDDEESTYLREFGQLIARCAIPGVRFALEDHSQAYGGSEAVLSRLREREATMPFPNDAERSSAARNLRIRKDEGGADDGGLQIEQQIIRAARRCAALLTLELRRDFNKFGPRIQITHIRGPSLSLHLGSCRSACAQPWVASGFFEWRPSCSSWIESLATDPSVLRSALERPMDHPLSDLSPALSTVRLLVRARNGSAVPRS